MQNKETFKSVLTTFTHLHAFQDFYSSEKFL